MVLDGHGTPLPEPLEVAHDLARSPDMQGSHHLVVTSEEQFKVRSDKSTQKALLFLLPILALYLLGIGFPPNLVTVPLVITGETFEK